MGFYARRQNIILIKIARTKDSQVDIIWYIHIRCPTSWISYLRSNHMGKLYDHSRQNGYKHFKPRATSWSYTLKKYWMAYSQVPKISNPYNWCKCDRIDYIYQFSGILSISNMKLPIDCHTNNDEYTGCYKSIDYNVFKISPIKGGRIHRRSLNNLTAHKSIVKVNLIL